MRGQVDPTRNDPLAPRRAGAMEVVVGAIKRASWAVRRRHRETSGFGVVLDSELPALYGSLSGRGLLGLAEAAGKLDRAVILFFPPVSRETPGVALKVRRSAVMHRRAHPGHTLVFLCNTAAETELLRAAGEVAFQINQNIFVAEGTFRPLSPPRPLLYDAVYNARLAPVKRHELSLSIERCALIYYNTPEETAASDEAVRARHRREAPGHVFINPLDEAGLPRMIPRSEINEVFNESAVGLCLSAREGAMFASMEYMLAGLPVVSTPSIGGRDVYFDDEYCVIVEPDARQIRDAVAALRQRAIPRDYIAARTLDKIERDRQRLLDLIDDLRGRAGLPRRNLTAWPFRDAFPLAWRPWGDFVAGLPSTPAADTGGG